MVFNKIFITHEEGQIINNNKVIFVYIYTKVPYMTYVTDYKLSLCAPAKKQTQSIFAKGLKLI